MGKNIFLRALGISFFTAICYGCSNNLDMPDADSGRTLELRISSGLNPASRTVLPGANNVQHVTKVALYLFKHTSAEDTLGASFVGMMTFDQVNWQQAIDAASTTGASTQRQSVNIPKEWIPEENRDSWFTFLAIGSDETKESANSTKTYGLEPSANGKTLGDFYAELQTSCTMNDIHQSELFAGTLTLKGAQVNSSTVINLYRRVAGVKGYFRRIPNQVNGVEVASVRVVYWNKQLTAVPFFKRYPKDGIFCDYDCRSTLPSISAIPDKGEKFPDEALEACTYFTIPKDSFPQNIENESTGIVGEQEKVDYATAGSYVLPAPGAVGSENATLYVLLMSADGTVLDKRRVFFNSSYATRSLTRSATDQGTGIIGGQPGDESELNRQRRYPIIANNFYSIGTADEPIDLSTGETEVNLYVDPTWEGYHEWSEIISVTEK